MPHFRRAQLPLEGKFINNLNKLVNRIYKRFHRYLMLLPPTAGFFVWKWATWNFILEILEPGRLDARLCGCHLRFTCAACTRETSHLHPWYKVVDLIKSYNFHIKSTLFDTI